uniref:Uncharacterized protein n=1 Tax=Rhizophora mucronata TaxID=61149 RepID=A0A2P2MPG3_RHIMU
MLTSIRKEYASNPSSTLQLCEIHYLQELWGLGKLSKNVLVYLILIFDGSHWLP